MSVPFAPSRLTVALLLACSLNSAVRAEGPQTSRRVRFNEGIILFSERDYAAAEAVFTELNSARPDDPAALYWLGLCQLQANRYEAAQQSFSQVTTLAPEYTEVRLDTAIAMIGRDQFEPARAILESFISAEGLDDVTRRQAQYFLAVAMYRTESFDAALAALDRAADGEDDPGMLAYIDWYRAWVFVEQRRNEDAVSAFRGVAERTPDLDLAARATTMADEVSSGLYSGEGVSVWRLQLDLGMHFDTNVILLGDDTSTPVALATKDDVRFGLTSDVRYLHPLGPSWLLGVGAGTFNSWHSGLQEFNVQTYGARAFVNYFATSEVTLGLQYEVDYSLVDNSAFLSRQRLTPSVRWVQATTPDGGARTASTLFYAYEDRNYHEDLFDLRSDRDGDYHTVGLTQDVRVSQPRLQHDDERWLTLAVGYRFKNESTQGDDFDMTGHSLSADVRIPLPNDWLLAAGGSWAWEDYWQPNTQDHRRRQRDDFVQRYDVSLERAFAVADGVEMTLRGEVLWTLDDSNVRNRLGEAIYSYDRVVAGVSIGFTFD